MYGIITYEHGRRCALTAALLYSCLVGCASDPTSPDQNDAPKWESIPLPADLPDGVLTGVAFHGGRSIAVGIQAVPIGGIVVTSDGDGWTTLPTNVDGPLNDVVFTPESDAVAIGRTRSFLPFVLDERTGWTANEILQTPGFLCCAEVGIDGTLRTVGGLTALRNLTAGQWETETVTFPNTSNEKGIIDLTVGSDGSFYACGFDDGGEGTPEEPFRMIMQNAGNGWSFFAPILEAPNASQLAYDPEQGFFVAGEQFQRDGQPLADLWVRDLEGDWTEIDLPGALGWSVRDLLVTPDGCVYLTGTRFATGDIMDGVLWRWDGATAKQEVVWPMREPRKLENDGSIVYVVGVDSRSGSTRPWMARREVP